MTSFEKLLEQLPPDRRAEAALSLEKLSNDRNSPIFGLYAEILVGIGAKNQEIESRLSQKLTASNIREKQLADQLVQAQADHLRVIQKEAESLSELTSWHRVITTRIIGAALLFTMGLGLASLFIYTKIRDAAPKLHDQIAAIDAKFEAQTEREASMQKLFKEGFEATAPITTHTIIGECLSKYITKVNRHSITLKVPDLQNVNGFASFRAPHSMQEAEYNKLKQAYQISPKIE